VPSSGSALERVVGERRVAGAEDQVRLLFDAELLLQRGLHVALTSEKPCISVSGNRRK
jgi:hypothetical protein